MGKSKRNKARRLDPVALAQAEVRAAEATLLAKRQAAARAAAAMVNGQASPEDQYAEFLNRPGDYYVARFEVGGKINETQGVTYIGECVLKADEEQMPYLVEIIRQIRGGFGEQARITLSRAQTVQQRIDPRPTATNVAMHRLQEQHARAVREAEAAAMPPVNGYPNTLPVDPFEAAAADLLPGGELSREQLQEQLPGMTRREVADELGVDPAEIGGDIKGAGSIDVEQLAAELGVSPLDLMPIKASDGSTVYAVKPGAGRPPAGRHARPEDDPRDDSGRGA